METVVEVQDTPYQQGARKLKLDVSASLEAVLTDPECPAFLQRALRGKVPWQKRNDYSIRKTLLAPGLAPQWVGALLAWGAWVVLEDGSEQPLSELLAESRKPDSMAALYLPLDVPGRSWADARTGSTPADYPIVWAMAVVDLDGDAVRDARLALTGAWRQSAALAEAAELLRGKPLDDESIQQAAEAAAHEVSPRGDYRGSVEYRTAMAGLMTRRALQSCREGVEA